MAASAYKDDWLHSAKHSTISFFFFLYVISPSIHIMKLLLLCALIGFVSCDKRPPSNGYGAPPAPSNGYDAPPLSSAYGAPSSSYGVDPAIAALAENIPGGGVPGEDYPILASVPETDFSCDDQKVPGYYADTADEAGCQVFHICQERPNGRRQQDSFLCPNGTIFNQQYLVCDWWFNFDCSIAQDFYKVNELIGVIQYGNGNGINGYGSKGNGDRKNGYGSNGNGKKNGNGNGNGNSSNGNGATAATNNDIYGPPVTPDNSYSAPAAPGNGYGAPTAPSNGYGAPTAPSNGYGAPTAPSNGYGAPPTPYESYGVSF